MKTLKLKSILFSILTVVMLSVFVTSCDKDEETIENSDVVQFENDILTRALNTTEVTDFQSKAHGGELATEYATYEEVIDDNGVKDAAIITIPIQSNAKNQSKGLYIHYDFLTEEFNHEVIAVTFGESFVNQVRTNKITSIDHLSDAELNNLGLNYSATYEFFALDGILAGRLTYENNKLVEDYENPSRASNWCIFKCMVGKTSWKERYHCGVAVISCVSGNWYSCLWNIYRCAKNGPRYYRECKPGC